MPVADRFDWVHGYSHSRSVLRTRQSETGLHATVVEDYRLALFLYFQEERLPTTGTRGEVCYLHLSKDLCTNDTIISKSIACSSLIVNLIFGMCAVGFLI